MKIAIVTDIHHGLEDKKGSLKYFIENLNADILVSTGDWGMSNLSQIEDAFRIIHETNPFLKVVTTFGNHDFWDDSPFKLSLDELIDKRLEICEKYKVHSLEDHGLFLEKTFVIGGYNGWYTNITTRNTNDSFYLPQINTYGAPTEQVLCRLEQIALGKMLDDLDAISGKIKIGVTHFNLISNVGYETMSGNPRYLPIVEEKLDILITGHTHQAFHLKKTVQNRQFEYFSIGADYDFYPDPFQVKILDLK